MQQTIIFKRFMLFFVIFVTIIAVAMFTLNDAVPQKEPLNNEQPVATPMYIVKSEGNKVGVYKGSNASPEYYIDVLANSLPEHDRELLKIGIEIYTEEELIKITEDLES